MPVVLFTIAALLAIWGAGVYVTGDYVATLDIAANLVSAAAIVAALGCVVGAIDRLPAGFGRTRVYDEPVDNDDEHSLPLVASPEAPRQVPPVAVFASDPIDEVPDEPDGPKLVREGVIDGRVYRYFDDGSIHADGPNGPHRYASIDELRAEILSRTDRRPPHSPQVPPSVAASVVAPAVMPPMADSRENTEWPSAPDIRHEADYEGDERGADGAFAHDELRGGFEGSEAVPDRHVDEPHGSSWAGPFRSILGRRRERDERVEPDTRDEDKGPRF